MRSRRCGARRAAAGRSAELCTWQSQSCRSGQGGTVGISTVRGRAEPTYFQKICRSHSPVLYGEPHPQRALRRQRPRTVQRHAVCGPCLRRVHGHSLNRGMRSPSIWRAAIWPRGSIWEWFLSKSRGRNGWSGMGIHTGAGCCRSSDPYPYGQGTMNAGVAVSTNCMTGSGYTPRPTMNIIENTMTAMTPRGSLTRFSPSPSKYIFLMTQP